MSAAPLILQRPETRQPERVAQPKPQARPKSQPRTKVQPLSASAVTSWASCLFLLSASTYVLSMLAGQTMVEKARREAIQAGARAKAARADLAMLRERTMKLSSLQVVDAWASSRGFLVQEGFTEEKPKAPGTGGLVAMHHSNGMARP